MESFKVLWLTTVFVGYFFGYWVARLQYGCIFKRFSKEMHKQYLFLLQRHGVELNSEGEEILNESNYKLRGEKGLL